ncbi:MAG: OmpA family protein [Gemmatimonadaceae bacterium]|jgi:peptidoglycan-associated lipoprotein|nr:OmpA family protein [Gemmatimonadaceae bacterium]MCC6432086.1 OmpA family protein [Gemmatimonadaceae bacterium]
MNRSSRLFVLVAASTLALGACKKKTTPVVPAPTPASNPTTPTRTEPAATAPVDNSAEIRAKIAAARAVVLSAIYFEYDADELRDDAKASLDEKLKVLNANPGLRIRVAGHTDERGSDEYNIALGRRRAETAKRYLTDRGIDASRIETSTFGRERPAMQGSSEEAWSKNRRDEFEIIAGGDQLRAP